ncbi:hypothetical protein TNCV_3400691 [Trichonephila clavipes]|nr:hypothetical protein TNCV_3400691 [Trichonephila clavipes]
MLAHFGIPGNETADKLAKKERDLNDGTLDQTVHDVNVIARHRLKGNPKVDSQICEREKSKLKKTSRNHHPIKKWALPRYGNSQRWN